MKGNKTIAKWNVQRTNIHGGRVVEVVNISKWSGMDTTLLTALSTFGHGIKKFEIDGESMYLLQMIDTYNNNNRPGMSLNCIQLWSLLQLPPSHP